MGREGEKGTPKRSLLEDGDGDEEMNGVGAAMSIRLLLKLLLLLLNQCDAALATGRLADPAEVVPGRGLPVGEDVAPGHLLQLRVAQVLLRRPGGGLVALEDAVAGQVAEFLRGDLLRRLHHAVFVISFTKLDIAHL